MKKTYVFLTFFLFMAVSFIFDEQIMSFFQSLRFYFLDVLMNLFTSMIFLTVVLILFSFLILERKLIFKFLFGTGLSYIISYILKQIIRMPRPIDANSMGFAFPSSHATVYFFIAAFMSDKFKEYKYYFFALAVIVGISRIYLGDHNLSDVIAGGLLGYGIYLLYKKWLKIKN